MKRFAILACFCTLCLACCTSCKEKAPTEPTQTPEVQVPDVPADTPEAQDAPGGDETAEDSLFDYGDDELGQALNAYQKQGYWFREKKPELIENLGSRIDFYQPFVDADGKTWQFAKLARSFNFDGELVSRQWPVLFIYEGTENLRSAIETFSAHYQDFERNGDVTDVFRSLIPQEETQISGGVKIKDSYPINDLPTSDMYEGKKVFVFGFKYADGGTVEYMFNLK